MEKILHTTRKLAAIIILILSTIIGITYTVTTCISVYTLVCSPTFNVIGDMQIHSRDIIDFVVLLGSFFSAIRTFGIVVKGKNKSIASAHNVTDYQTHHDTGGVSSGGNATREPQTTPKNPKNRILAFVFSLLCIFVIFYPRTISDDITKVDRMYLQQNDKGEYDYIDLSSTAKVVLKLDVIHGWVANEYQYVLFGSYIQKDGYYEPILWRVLYAHQCKVLLLSEYIIDTRKFDIVDNTWADSEIKAWLNESFYSSSFSEFEKKAIIYNNDPGSIFLLSLQDLTNPNYGFSKDSGQNRRASGSYYAMNHGLWKSSADYSSYFTRTPSYENTVYQIRSTGVLGAASVDRLNIGIRPAVWIDLTDACFDYGDGSIKTPFQKLKIEVKFIQNINDETSFSKPNSFV